MLKSKYFYYCVALVGWLVWMDARGSKSPVAKYWGTMSFTLHAAINPAIGTPIFLASSPAHKFPKLPLGTQK